MSLHLIKVGVIWDDETFADCKQAWQTKSFPYLDFCELGLTKNFKWISHDQMGQEMPLSQSKEHDIVLPSIKQLLECDVCLPLLSSQKESSIQGFLDILGKPYVKEGRTKWMMEKQNLEHLILIALQEKRCKDRS